MSVRCRFEGCGANFKVSKRKEHEDTCDLQLMLCGNSDLCGLLTRRTIKFHEEHSCLYRLVSCELCGQPCPANNTKDHLKSDCPDVPVDCPNNCKESITRKSLSSHIHEDCKKGVVGCPFGPHGCLQEVTRENLASHLEENLEYHLSLTSAMMLGQQLEIEQLRSQINGMSQDPTLFLLRDGVERVRQAMCEVFQNANKHYMLFFFGTLMLSLCFSFTFIAWLHIIVASYKYYKNAVLPKIQHDPKMKVFLTMGYPPSLI